MYGSIIAELRSFYIYHQAEDLWDETMGVQIERTKFYNDSLFKTLVHLLAVKLNKEPSQILVSFGEFLVPYLLKVFPINLEQDIIQLLSNVEKEVDPFRKEIQLVDMSPFNIRKVNNTKIEMLYNSRRDMPELRMGIIQGIARQMDQQVELNFQRLEDRKTLITVKRID